MPNTLLIVYLHGQFYFLSISIFLKSSNGETYVSTNNDQSTHFLLVNIRRYGHLCLCRIMVVLTPVCEKLPARTLVVRLTHFLQLTLILHLSGTKVHCILRWGNHFHFPCIMPSKWDFPKSFSQKRKKKKGEQEAGFRKELLHAQRISAPGERSHHRLFLELRCEFANGKWNSIACVPCTVEGPRQKGMEGLWGVSSDGICLPVL